MDRKVVSNVPGSNVHPSPYCSQGVLRAATLERVVEVLSGSVSAEDSFEDFCAIGAAFAYKAEGVHRVHWGTEENREVFGGKQEHRQRALPRLSL